MITANNRETMRPYVDYYAGLALVHHRDISDQTLHFARRESLYRMLGILPRMVCGAAVLEIGPGPGGNSLYTAALGPASYTLVDGNPFGIAACRELLGPAFPNVAFTFIEGFVDDVPAGGPYDLVLAEGMLSAQHDPATMARAIGAHVAPGGIYVLTCMEDLAYLGEITRRIIGHQLVPIDRAPELRVRELAALFAPHLKTFGEMSRSPLEWVTDNIAHPLPGPLFPIDHAIAALDEHFDFYGSSPDFVVDWRWYKRLHSGQRDDNGRATRAYAENVLGLLDHRVVPAAVAAPVGARARALANRLYRAATGADFGTPIDFAAAIDTIDELAALVEAPVPSAALALRECADVLRGSLTLDAANNYAPFFGSGQQYVSFTRRVGQRV